MGGNALKNFGVERVNRETFIRIRDFVLKNLDAVTSAAAVPYFVDSKESFGDIDILAVINYSGNLRDWIQETFKPRAIIKNGNIYSFNVENLQIDLIITTQEDFEIYFTFLSWGDLSMTMGRIARLWDLKYGIYGLEIPLCDPETNHVVETALVSKNPRKIFEFFGYSFDRWLEGFKTNEEVRDFLFSSPRIHRGFLTADSENVKHRKRDRQRAAYGEWYKWFHENREKFPEEAELAIPQDFWGKIDYVESFFPESNLREKCVVHLEKIKQDRLVREKFSGSQISLLFPELSGKDFGELMKAWNAQWANKEEKNKYILNHSVEELKHNIKFLQWR